MQNFKFKSRDKIWGSTFECYHVTACKLQSQNQYFVPYCLKSSYFVVSGKKTWCFFTTDEKTIFGSEKSDFIFWNVEYFGIGTFWIKKKICNYIMNLQRKFWELERTPQKSIGFCLSVELAKFWICCRFYHSEQKSQWAQSSKVSTLATTKLESSKATPWQDRLKTFFLLFLKYTFMFLRSLIPNLMSN